MRGKMGDLKRRLLFLLGALIVFRIGAHIPVPGIDPVMLADLFKSQKGGILDMFNPKETADNLKKNSAFVPGIRPGEQTARYIEKIMMRLTLVGSIYVTLVALLPEFLIVWKNVPFYFGGTSLLIIVVVTMDFMAQVQAYIMSHQYESLLKKANFKGGGLQQR